jgi:hypothetical protein
MNRVRRLLANAFALALVAGSAHADGWYMDDSRHEGIRVRLGRVTATHSAGHDAIRVEGRNDDFRKLNFRVSDSPLNKTPRACSMARRT